MSTNVKTRLGGRQATRDPNREFEIDLALAVMCALQLPGQCLKHRDIAEVTGLSHGGPFAIEQAALKKIRKRMYSSANKECAALKAFFREMLR